MMDEKVRKLIAKYIRKDPLNAYWIPCPLNAICQYLEIIPDPFVTE
jgi:hypothetical protein